MPEDHLQNAKEGLHVHKALAQLTVEPPQKLKGAPQLQKQPLSHDLIGRHIRFKDSKPISVIELPDLLRCRVFQRPQARAGRQHDAHYAHTRI